MVGNFFQMILWNTLRSMGFRVNWLVEKPRNKMGWLSASCSSYISLLVLAACEESSKRVMDIDFSNSLSCCKWLPPWQETESSPFELIYHRKPNVSYFRNFGLFVMFMYWNIIELNFTQRTRNEFLLAMIHIERRLLYLVMWCLMKFHVTKTMQMVAKVQLLLHAFVMILH